jgi:alpha-mannosidase
MTEKIVYSIIRARRLHLYSTAIRALVYTAAGRVELQEQPRPTVGASETEIAVEMAGICGSTLPVVSGNRFGPCVSGVGEFVCIGLNYSDHAAEAGMKVPAEAVVSMKATSAICEPNDEVVIPRGGARTDWEAELGGSHLAGGRVKIVSKTLAVFILVIFAMIAWGQTQPGTPSEPVVDSVSSELQKLTRLQAEEWRYHAGDLTHGEDIALDDSSWQTIKPKFDAPEEAVWFRCWVQVPQTLNGYDLTGAKLWFQFVAYGNGPMPEIVYYNGRRVAMGEDLEPIVLLDPVKPGDKVLIAVKLLHTVDKKHLDHVDIRVDFSATRPSPLELYQELQSAWKLSGSLGANAQPVHDAIKQAALSVDLEALKKANQGAFDSSLAKAHSILLLGVKPQLRETSVRLTGNAHIDAAWLWPWTETVDVVRRTFGTALQLMHEYPQYTFTQSAAAYNDWMLEKYPDLHRQIVDRVKEGRWEMVGGMWVEPDLNMPDGESLVRQLLIGKRYFKQKFGVDVRIGWNPDSFGYTWQLPQIYKKSGVDYFVTQKMAWNDTNKLPLKLFWWQSPDGSRVLTYFPHDYVNEIEPVAISTDVAIARKLNPGLPEMMHLYGIGDHGGGPTRSMLDSGMRWTSPDRVVPQMSFGPAQGFFLDLESKLDNEHVPVWNYKTMASGQAELPVPPAGKFALPVWNDELYFEYHRGVMTTQANHKRNMRDSEEWLLNAEKYSSLAWLSGSAYPNDSLTEGWHKVLFNQFHDLAAGSGIGVIYKDSQRDYDQVQWSTNEITENSLRTIFADVNTNTLAGGAPVAIVNPLAWARTDLATVDVQLPSPPKNGLAVVDAAGKPLPFQVISKSSSRNSYRLLVEVKDVPSLGYEVVRVLPQGQPVKTDLLASGFTLENSALRVVVDPKTGCITSLFDKRTKFESIAAAGCGNQMQAFKDTPKDYDAWNIDSDFEKEVTVIDRAESVQLIEQGPVRATIRVTRNWQNSKFVQDISLYAGLDRVDIANSIDWHETHVLLKAAFPLAASAAQATYEIPYGTIERPTTRNNSWEQAKFEVPALRWADLGDGAHGFSLINESKYGYDAKGNVLRLSLLRSPTWPDPEADRGHHTFTYSLYPHGGNWKQALTVRRGYEFNYKLHAFQLPVHDGKLASQHSYVEVEGVNVVLTSLKKAEDSDALILRVYEFAGKNSDVTLRVPPGATGATLTNLQEKPEGRALTVSEDRLIIPVHSFEIVSVRVDYPSHAGSEK